MAVKKTTKKTVKKTAVKKTSKKTKSPEKEKPESATTASKYFEAVGSRKTSVARVRIFSGKGSISVNDKDYKDYFPLEVLQKKILSPLEVLKLTDNFNVSIKVYGGGISSQAEASRHGIARALLKYNSEYRKKLKRLGFLTRDSRVKERKKFGLKKARRAPQWSKR